MADEVKKEEKKEVVVPEKFKSLVEQIEKMSVLDLAELVKILEDKFGVSAAAPMMAMAAGAAAAPAEEKDAFDVELSSIGSDKIGAIKVVRELTELGLKEAKDLVEKAPKMVKQGVKKEDAETMKKKLEAVGCKVALK
ncbi:MAG: 50S ribosomal protein L7/L12 [Patescibacteria group bacterium]|jgi:large subunit ribosomal protein L7/L12